MTMIMALAQTTSGKTSYHFLLTENSKKTTKKQLLKMKKIYIILFSVLAIPMSAFAQVEHLFPEIRLNYNGVEYYIPAWDALTADGMRVQNTGEKTDPNDPGVGDDGETQPDVDPDNPFNNDPGPSHGDDDIIIDGVNGPANGPAKSRSLRYEMNGIIVSGSAIPSDLSCTSGNMGKAYWYFVSNSPKNVTINGKEYNDARTITYSQVLNLDETQMNPIYKNVYLFSRTQIPENNNTNRVQLENYTIPSTANPFEEDDVSHASKFNIIGLGDMAYYNKGMDWQFDNLICAKKITIPNHIKFLGQRCFQSNGLLLEVVFEEGSEITKIPNGCFHACKRLREVNIPATVTSIGDHAFAARNLWKIKFEGDNAPSMTLDAFKKFEAGTSAPDCRTEYCVMSVKNEDVVMAFRQQNEIFNGLNFCMPVTINGYNMKSYCGAGLLVNQKILTKGVDDENNASSDVKNTWELADGEESNSVTGGLKLFYVNRETGVKSLDGSGNKTITLQRIRTKPAGPYFGLILAGDEGVHDLFFVKGSENQTDTLESPVNQMLVGTSKPVDMASVIESSQNKKCTIFILKNGQFRLSSNGTLAARKAYLRMPNDFFKDLMDQGDRLSKDLSIDITTGEDDTDGIVAIDNSQLTIDNVYDLSGRKVAENAQLSTLPKGIYIMNGKKYILK